MEPLGGRPARACETPGEAVGGADILTIEGVPGDGSHAVQRACLELDVAQCGHCQPGQILSAVALLAVHPQRMMRGYGRPLVRHPMWRQAGSRWRTPSKRAKSRS